MVELFTEIPEEAKKRAEFVFNMALRQNDMLNAVKILNEYTNSCVDEEEQEFVEFYFRMRLEELLNG